MNTCRWLLPLAAVALLGAAASSPGHGATLYDPSFELAPSPLPGLVAVIGIGPSQPFTPGLWGADAAIATTPMQGISPNCPIKMLGAARVTAEISDVMQAVDVRADANCINSNQAEVTFRALLNGHNPGGSIPAISGSVGLQFFAGDYWSGETPEQHWTTITLDDSDQSWESVSVTRSVPPGTRWIIVRLAFTNETLTDGRYGFVDCAELQLECPPPSECPRFGTCTHSTDINGDGCVNLTDVVFFANDLVSGNPRSDFNCDGVVNLTDLPIFVHCVGYCG